MNKTIAWAGALAGAALLAGAAPAWAACSLAAGTIPVTMDGMRATVQASVNGQDAKMMIDSGAFFNSITAEYALDHKLRAATVSQTGSHLPAGAQVVMNGAAGLDKVAAIVIADKFQFGGMAFKNTVFLTTVKLGDVSGIVGQNFLHLYDVEYDLAHGAMKIVQPKDCKNANLAYWAVGTPYSVVPLELDDQGDPHTQAIVTINGVKMKAMFDTGAGTSFITQGAAARAGIRVTDPGVTSSGFASGLDKDRIKTWTARFADIKIGDEEIKNGQLEIGESDATFFDILIGADFFLSHHVYVANSQHKIYFTYDGGQVFNLAHREQAPTTAPDR